MSDEAEDRLTDQQLAVLPQKARQIYLRAAGWEWQRRLIEDTEAIYLCHSLADALVRAEKAEAEVKGDPPISRALHDDIAELCRVVGHFAGAQPKSPRVVLRECIVMVKRLREENAG